MISNEKYYEIEVCDKFFEKRIFYCNNKSRYFTFNRSEAKVYYSLSGAKQGVKAVKRLLGENTEVRINTFNANTDI